MRVTMLVLVLVLAAGMAAVAATSPSPELRLSLAPTEMGKPVPLTLGPGEQITIGPGQTWDTATGTVAQTATETEKSVSRRTGTGGGGGVLATVQEAGGAVIDFGQQVADFALACLKQADGAGFITLWGSESQATAFVLERRLVRIDKGGLLGNVGLVTSVGGRSRYHATGGLKVTVGTVVGAQVGIGLNVVSSDISRSRIPLLDRIGIGIAVAPGLAMTKAL